MASHFSAEVDAFPQSSQTMRSPLYPGILPEAVRPSPIASRINRRRSSRDTPASAADFGSRFRDASGEPALLDDSFAATRIAFPLFASTKVAAIFPQSRNFRARLPRRHPVTTATASVAQRSISTNVTRRLRSFPCGIIDAEFLQAKHCQTHAQNLTGAQVSVGLLGVAQIFFESFMRSRRPLAVGLQLNTAPRARRSGGLFSAPANSLFRDFHEDAGFR